MKKLLSLFLLISTSTFNLNLEAAFTRLATETYPGGGGGVATNAVAGIYTNGVLVALDAQKRAHLVIPEGGGPTNGVTAAQVTNIWKAIAADRMVPQFDDYLCMTASESLMVSNIFQVGDTGDSLYIYEGGMAKGIQVNGQTEIDGEHFEGETIVAPGGIVTYADDPSVYSVLTATNLVLNGKVVGGPSEYVTNETTTAFIAADGSARRVKATARAWTPSESPRYDPPGFNDIYYNDIKYQRFAGMDCWTAKKWMYNGVTWIDKGYMPMLGDDIRDKNATTLMFPDAFSTLTELKETHVMENAHVAYSNDVVAATNALAAMAGANFLASHSGRHYGSLEMRGDTTRYNGEIAFLDNGGNQTFVSATNNTVTFSLIDGSGRTTSAVKPDGTKVVTAHMMTNYTDAVKANYLPLAGGTMTGDITMGNNSLIFDSLRSISAGPNDTMSFDADYYGFGGQGPVDRSYLTADGTPVVTSNMLNGVLAPATNALDTALRAEIDNEAYERQTADAKFLTKESTSYPATRNLKWSGYNLVLNGPMLFQNWDSIKAGTTATNEKLPEYITSRLAAYQTNLVVSTSTADKVLSNDGTNVFWTAGGGGGGGISAETATNIVASTAVTNMGAAAYADVAADVAAGSARSYTDTALEDHAAAADLKYQPMSCYSWVRPDDWCVDYTVSDTISTTTVISDKQDENLRMMRYEAVTKTPTRNGKATAVRLDPSTLDPVPPPTWEAVTSGIIVNSDGTFTTANDGLFRISATVSNVVRYADIAAQLKPVTFVTNVIYLSDIASTTRKTVNDTALSTLNAATLEGAHTVEGITYSLYNTFTPHMANVGAGNVSPFAASQHVLIGADHYYVHCKGPITFNDGTTSATVNRLNWVNLYDWAITNGFTEAELSSVRFIRDIDMIICDKTTAVPNGCIPYFMSKNTATQCFGESPVGVQAWRLSQYHNQAIPCVLGSFSSVIYDAYEESTYTPRYVRSDAYTKLKAMGRQVPVIGGDSGRPVFIMKDGHPVIMTNPAFGMGGPDYCGAFPVIKAFIEWYGDTIKEAN